jgi:hypothetical protein
MAVLDIGIERNLPKNEEAAAMAMKIADSMLAVANHLNIMRINLTALNITICGILLAARGRVLIESSALSVSMFLWLLAIIFSLFSLRISMTHGFHWDEYITYRTMAAHYHKIHMGQEAYAKRMRQNSDVFGEKFSKIMDIEIMKIFPVVNFIIPIIVSIIILIA